MDKYDFAGYVTKNDILCSDGVVIKKDAFTGSNGKRVPLVWNHDYNMPSNVLGHVILEEQELGTYGYGYFNNSEMAESAREMVVHGDVTSMSIGARKIKKTGNNVVHGDIYEVSLVLAGANPGALIDYVVRHKDDGEPVDNSAIIYTGTLIHSSDDIPDDELEEEEMEPKEYTREDIYNMDDDELDEFLGDLSDDDIESLAEFMGYDLDSHEDEQEVKDYDSDADNENEELEQSDYRGEVMKHNVFNGSRATDPGLSKEEQQTLLQSAINDKAESLQDVLQHAVVDPATLVGGTDFGIKNIEYLFPEVHTLDKQPRLVLDKNTAYSTIISSVSKVPFSKIRTRYFDIDITDEKQRAKGYVKGTRKVDEVIKVLKRETYPQTIYKKQQLDRDDIIEITDFDVVSMLNAEMRMLLEIELARAILIGDGREQSSDYKIDETKIRPILSDDEVYAIKANFANDSSFVESIILNMSEYEGSGSPTMYIDPKLLARVKLLKGTDGRYLVGHILTDSELATQMGVSKIVPTTLLKDTNTALVVNLADYHIGSTKGGQLATFADFDIDFNRYKYLIETRLSGALAYPKSAIVFTQDPDAEPETEPVTP